MKEREGVLRMVIAQDVIDELIYQPSYNNQTYLLNVNIVRLFDGHCFYGLTGVSKDDGKV